MIAESSYDKTPDCWFSLGGTRTYGFDTDRIMSDPLNVRTSKRSYMHWRPPIDNDLFPIGDYRTHYWTLIQEDSTRVELKLSESRRAIWRRLGNDFREEPSWPDF